MSSGIDTQLQMVHLRIIEDVGTAPAEDSEKKQRMKTAAGFDINQSKLENQRSSAQLSHVLG